MAENALLTEQKHVLANELDKHHIDLSSHINQIKSLNKELSKLKSDHEHLHQNLILIENDRNEAANQALTYSNLKNKLEAQVQGLNEDLSRSLDKEHQYLQLNTDLKKELTQINKSHEEDNFHMLKQVKIIEDRLRDVQLNLLEKTNENESLNDVIRKLKREYQNTRTDAEAMLQVMSGLEKQLSEYTSRENEVENIAKDSRSKLMEAISQRDQVYYTS